MSLPTDDEIRAVAEELGLLDEHGQVPREKRTQLAAVALKMRGVADDDSEPEQLTTAQALSRFNAELIEEGHTHWYAVHALAAATGALIARDGLILKENRTP